MADDFKIGAEIEVGHPFVRGMFTEHVGDGEGGWSEVSRPTWEPGIRHEWVQPDDTEPVADAVGSQILTVVSVHKPGRFPERVFYTRLWRDPDGREFGKGKLHIKTAQAFRRLIRGYRHEYRVADPKLTALTAGKCEGA
jgi:hypothetical protein